MKKDLSSQNKIIRLAETSILCAVVIVMAFTPLGYLKTPGLEITFITVPVIIGAIQCGPAAGAILGAVFGATSFFQCFGMSAFGATLLSVNPIFTFIVCVPTRILMGFLIGLIYKAIGEKAKKVTLGTLVASLTGPILNTLFFMSALLALFAKSEFIVNLMEQTGAVNIITFAAIFVGVQGLIEAGVCFVIGGAVSLALTKALKRRNRS